MATAEASHRRLRLFAIDEHEGVIAFTQTFAGKAILFALALGLLLLPPVVKRLDTPLWSVVVLLAAALHAYLPAYRGLVLFVFAWTTSLFWLPVVSTDDYGSLIIVMLVCWTSLHYVRRFKTHLLARRPVIALLSCLGVLTLVSSQIPEGAVREMSWSFLVILSVYIWYLSYAIVDQRTRNPSPDLVQMGVQQPFWLTSSTPVGKGAAFLRKHLSTTPRDLAVTQLKGLKLLVWMVILILIQMALYKVFIQTLGISTQEQAIRAFIAGSPYPVWANWLTVTLDTIFFSMYLAIYGHAAIGITRLAGFRLPRNTCRPMQSRTLAEFWNRYNFYFKEVMVDFFYIPTFLKMFRNHPRCRMFFATFMAAGVGNFVFHFIRDLYEVNTRGFGELVYSYASYALYCLLLATGIAISQLRAHAGIKPNDSMMGQTKSFFLVWGFIVLLQNFDINMRLYSVQDNLRFTASLFGF